MPTTGNAQGGVGKMPSQDCGANSVDADVCTVPSHVTHNFHEAWDVPDMYLASPTFNPRANLTAAWRDGAASVDIIRSLRTYANYVIRLFLASQQPGSALPQPIMPPPRRTLNTGGSASGGQSMPTQPNPGTPPMTGQAPVPVNVPPSATVHPVGVGSSSGGQTPPAPSKPHTPGKGMKIPDGIDMSEWYHPDYD